MVVDATIAAILVASHGVVQAALLATLIDISVAVTLKLFTVLSLPTATPQQIIMKK